MEEVLVTDGLDVSVIVGVTVLLLLVFEQRLMIEVAEELIVIKDSYTNSVQKK